MVRKILGIAVIGFAGSMAVSAAAAMRVKRQIVPTTDPEADEIALAAIFAPLEFSSRAKQFRGGTVDMWFGGGVLDLRGATLAPAGATLRVRAIFGGGQILVPEDWKVTTAVQGIGGVSNEVPLDGRAVNAPVLTVVGIVLFGGLSVTAKLYDGEALWLEDLEATKAATTEEALAVEPEPEMAPAG